MSSLLSGCFSRASFVCERCQPEVRWRARGSNAVWSSVSQLKQYGLQICQNLLICRRKLIFLILLDLSSFYWREDMLCDSRLRSSLFFGTSCELRSTSTLARSNEKKLCYTVGQCWICTCFRRHAMIAQPDRVALVTPCTPSYSVVLVTRTQLDVYWGPGRSAAG